MDFLEAPFHKNSRENLLWGRRRSVRGWVLPVGDNPRHNTDPVEGLSFSALGDPKDHLEDICGTEERG
ncbi:MAG: hypothetical protein DMG06_20320 [Acidobacteria bacterium]|nr:MAG: hypothetical protein DMG06_20320 [Acidobacteriota bacterium]